MEKERRNLSVGNVYGVDISAIVINDKCFDVLTPFINNHAQVFQTRYENNLAYVLNITEIIDCLDYEHSKLKFFKSSGRLMRVEEYVFDKAALDDAVIFKPPEELKAQPYVTGQFKKITESNGIKGFKFKLVWECD